MNSVSECALEVPTIRAIMSLAEQIFRQANYQNCLKPRLSVGILPLPPTRSATNTHVCGTLKSSAFAILSWWPNRISWSTAPADREVWATDRSIHGAACVYSTRFWACLAVVGYPAI